MNRFLALLLITFLLSLPAQANKSKHSSSPPDNSNNVEVTIQVPQAEEDCETPTNASNVEVEVEVAQEEEQAQNVEVNVELPTAEEECETPVVETTFETTVESNIETEVTVLKTCNSQASVDLGMLFDVNLGIKCRGDSTYCGDDDICNNGRAVSYTLNGTIDVEYVKNGKTHHVIKNFTSTK